MKPVRGYAHVSGAIDEFDKKLKEYEAAGGDRPTESDLKRTVLKLMPNELVRYDVARGQHVMDLGNLVPQAALWARRAGRGGPVNMKL